MDFHALARKDLQFLCKRNRIPANQTNIAMADSLQALKTVEGIKEIQESFGLQSSKKAVENPSPYLSRTTGRISARRATHGDEPQTQQRQVPGKALEVTFKASMDAEGEKTEPPKVYPKTPGTRKAGKGAEASRSRMRAKKEEKEEEGPCETTPKTVEAEKGKADAGVLRRSARLSSWKPVEVTATVQSKSTRRSARAKKVVNKMGSLDREDVDEKEMVEEKNDLTLKADEEAVEKDQEVESHGSSSSLGGRSSKAEAGKNSCLLLANELVKESGYEPLGNEPLEYSSDKLPKNDPTEDSGDPSPGNDAVKDSGNNSSENETLQESFSRHPSGSEEENYSCCMEVEKEKLGLFFYEITRKDRPPEAEVAKNASGTTIAAEIYEEIDESIDLAPDSKSETLMREAAVKFSVQVEENLPEARELAHKEPTEISPGAALEPQLISSSTELCVKFSVKDSPPPIEFTVESVEDVEDELQNAGKITTNESLTFQRASFEVPVSSAVSVIEPEEAGSMTALRDCDAQIKVLREEDIIHADTAGAADVAAISSTDEKLPGDSGDLSILQTPLLDSEEAGMTATEKVEEKVEIKSVEMENALDATETVEEEEIKSEDKNSLDAIETVEEETKSVEKENFLAVSSETAEEEEKSDEKADDLEKVEESAVKEISLAATEADEEEEKNKSMDKGTPLAAPETAEEEKIKSEIVEKEQIKSVKDSSQSATSTATVKENLEIKSVENLESLSLGQLKAVYKKKLEAAKNKNKVREIKSMINQEEVLDLEFSGSSKLDANSIKKKLNHEKIKPERKILVEQEDLECLSQSKSNSSCKKILNDDKFINTNKSEIKRTPLKNLN